MSYYTVEDLVKMVESGETPAAVLEKVLIGNQPLSFLAQVFAFIKNTPGITVKQVLKQYPVLEPQAAEIPKWISDTLAGRSLIG